MYIWRIHLWQWAKIEFLCCSFSKLVTSAKSISHKESLPLGSTLFLLNLVLIGFCNCSYLDPFTIFQLSITNIMPQILSSFTQFVRSICSLPILELLMQYLLVCGSTYIHFEHEIKKNKLHLQFITHIYNLVTHIYNTFTIHTINHMVNS